MTRSPRRRSPTPSCRKSLPLATSSRCGRGSCCSRPVRRPTTCWWCSRASCSAAIAGEEILVLSFGPGSFVGELTLLTGQRRFLSCRAVEAGRVLVVEQPQFRRLMSVRPALAETIFGALLARREHLAIGPGCRGDQDHRLALLAGGDGPAHVRRALAHSAHLGRPRGRRGRRRAAGQHGRSAQETPVVITPTRMLRRALPGEFAEELGLTFQPVPGYIFDLVVVGTGPAGLAAAVYGASEGLGTVSPRRGRGRRSGRHELEDRELRGFPNGISGRGPDGAGRGPGAAARRAAERTLRGRRPARRAQAFMCSRSRTAARSRRGR